jgi:hypothetical protein
MQICCDNNKRKFLFRSGELNDIKFYASLYRPYNLLCNFTQQKTKQNK